MSYCSMWFAALAAFPRPKEPGQLTSLNVETNFSSVGPPIRLDSSSVASPQKACRLQRKQRMAGRAGQGRAGRVISNRQTLQPSKLRLQAHCMPRQPLQQ